MITDFLCIQNCPSFPSFYISSRNRERRNAIKHEQEWVEDEITPSSSQYTPSIRKMNLLFNDEIYLLVSQRKFMPMANKTISTKLCKRRLKQIISSKIIKTSACCNCYKKPKKLH